MKRALIGAVAVAVAAFATPALAQSVSEDSGSCAQFYPDANCQNLGADNPHAESGYWGSGNAIAPSYFAQSAEPNAYRYHGGPKFND